MDTKHVFYNFLLCRQLGELTLVSRDFDPIKPIPFDGYRVLISEGTYHCCIHVPFSEGELGLCTLRALFMQYVPSPSFCFIVRNDNDYVSK